MSLLDRWCSYRFRRPKIRNLLSVLWGNRLSCKYNIYLKEIIIINIFQSLQTYRNLSLLSYMFQRTKRQTGKQKVQVHGVSWSITFRSVKFNSFFVGHWLFAERQLGLLLLISYFVKEVSLATFFIHPLRRRSNEGNRQYGDPTHAGASEPLGSLISQNIFIRKHLILNCNFFCYFGISVVSKASLENTVFLLTYEKPYPPSPPTPH